MYWTDVNEQSPKIEYSWMTGEDRRTLVSERLLRPTGLAIDYYKNHRVFWCDGKLNVIESVNYDGSDRAVIARSGEPPQFGIASTRSLLREFRNGESDQRIRCRAG